MSASHPRKRDLVRNLFRPPSKTSPNPAPQFGKPLLSSAAPLPSPLPSPSHPLSSTSLGQKILDEALKALPPAQRATLHDHCVSGIQDIRVAVEEAYNAAGDQKRLCEGKRWQWKFRGRNIILRDEADKVLLWLDRFKSVGDVVANVAPLHAGLPWAGIRMILEVLHS